jgi:hypothetical protein
MDKKLVISVMAAVVLIGFLAGCAEKPPEEAPAPTAVLTPTPKVTPAPTPTFAPVVEAAISCDICHIRTSTVELEAHREGGQSCMGSVLGPCHSAGQYGGPNATVHTVHPPEVTCRQCHIVAGELVIPQTGKFSSCEACHGYPNPLDPSDGRLVEIHLDRGKDCQTCHAGEISEIHAMRGG